jgi:hypothetical protein
MYLAWTMGQLLEVAIVGMLITAAMAVMVAFPFIAERFIDDQEEDTGQV